MDRRIHIVGRKNSGKTTLVVDLVREFCQRGFSVGTVKHTHHAHELDVPGKDSHRLRMAGSTATAIISPNVSAVFRPKNGEDSDERYEEIQSMFFGCDLILVEGHAKTKGTKFEVWRPETNQRPIAEQDPSIHSIVTNEELTISTPVLKRSDVPRVCDEIIRILGI